jgi:L1 cell adhesion molecule like protein
MLSDAEKYKAEDEKVLKTLEAKNHLENYCYSVKNTAKEDKGKISEEDKKLIEDVTSEALQWLGSSSDKDASAFEAKQKEVEGKLSPIMAKMYQNADSNTQANTAGS